MKLISYKKNLLDSLVSPHRNTFLEVTSKDRKCYITNVCEC